MKTLFIDCSMGAAGDMLSAALLELFENKKEVLGELNSLGLHHTVFEMQSVTKVGIAGTKLRVLINGTEEGEHTENPHSHTHNSLKSITDIINGANANAEVKEKAISVYRLLAEAESKVHNTTVDNIHFHEVGTLDAVADILAFCYLFDKLGIDFAVASPVKVGRGSVRCAHGLLPVPAPATAELLKGVPIYGGETDGELCTPTGAALLKAFVNVFSDMPKIKTERIGYGMGTKDFGTANCVRMLLGEAYDEAEQIIELSFNVDDMTAEEIAFGTEELLHFGARDVFTTPVFMKKNRLGTLVSVLCLPEEKEKTINMIFKLFSTIGLRETLCSRYLMKRSVESVETRYGTVRIKKSEGYGQKKIKYEYDDLAKIARDNNLSIREILKSIEKEEN